MKTLALILLLFTHVSSYHAANLIEIMRSVNTEVDLQKDIPIQWKTEQVRVENFNKAIQLHLLHVEYVLRNRPVNQLNENQKYQRNYLLNTLKLYALKGQFPLNNITNYKTPVFIDKAEIHCAVGFLLKESGFGKLAKEISLKQNLAYVKEIKVKGLTDWAYDHGFSVNELAWIQPGYPPATTVTPLLGGMNGDVHSIIEYQSNIYAAGNFSTADGINAQNIAVYIAGFAGYLWTEVEGGTNGPINKLQVYGNDLIAAGNFSQAGEVSARGVALLNNGVWQAMGEGLDGTVHDLCVWNNVLYAFGDFDIIGSDTDGKNVAAWNGNSWDDVGLSTNGPVYAAYSGSTLIIGGEFSLVGNTLARNIANWDASTISAIGSGPETPVYDILEWNSKLIVAGKLIHNNTLQGILQFNNGTWNPLNDIDFIAQSDSSGSIRSLIVINNELIAGGNFALYPVMGTVGYGLAKWTDPNLSTTPLAWLDSAVYTCADIGGLYIGGAFRAAYGNVLNGIARVDNITSIQLPKTLESKLNAFPIPSNGSIKLVNIGEANSIQLLDIAGRLINTYTIQEGTIIPINSSGAFIIKTNSGESIKFINSN